MTPINSAEVPPMTKDEIEEMQAEISVATNRLRQRGFDLPAIAKELLIAGRHLAFFAPLMQESRDNDSRHNQFIYRTGTLTIAPGDKTAVFSGTMLNSGAGARRRFHFCLVE